jgi:hypothetical protein
MVPTVCDEQLVEEAERVKGEITCSPLDGLLMLTDPNAVAVEMNAITRE